jgi:hypothetical protein
MVSFLSLFLGLVVGHQTVTVEVVEPVAHVEILLDGRSVETFEAPPWSGQIDLGEELQPHELTAVAFDHNGVELDRTSQWINLPRQPAETTILLEHDRASRRQVARVSWESLTGDEPSAVRAEFDGRDLEFDDPRAIPLPPYDPAQLHFLRVELEFAGFVHSSAEITFGGTYTDQVNTELTAFPVVPATGRKKLPKTTELQDGFLARDKILRIAAVEKGLVDLIVVRDQGAWSDLRRIRDEALKSPSSSRILGSMEQRRHWFVFDATGWPAWTVQFLWPVSRRLDRGTGSYDLFSHSAKYSAAGGSLLGWLTSVEQPAEWSGDQRLADAIAIAAITAASGNRRRGILLILGDSTKDTSDAAPGTIRRFLKSLAVPLFVWKIGPDGALETPWGAATDASSPKRMSRASRGLFRHLESQRIIWLEGIHLPQQVTLAPALQDKVKASG